MERTGQSNENVGLLRNREFSLDEVFQSRIESCLNNRTTRVFTEVVDERLTKMCGRLNYEAFLEGLQFLDVGTAAVQLQLRVNLRKSLNAVSDSYLLLTDDKIFLIACPVPVESWPKGRI